MVVLHKDASKNRYEGSQHQYEAVSEPGHKPAVDVNQGPTPFVKDIRGISKEARSDDTIIIINFAEPSWIVRVEESIIA